jgi:hypothetical protein
MSYRSASNDVHAIHRRFGLLPNRKASQREGLDSEEARKQMEKRTARHASARSRKREERHEDLPTWCRTRPRGNPEVDRADLERSTERLEMLLGH